MEMSQMILASSGTPPGKTATTPRALQKATAQRTCPPSATLMIFSARAAPTRNSPTCFVPLLILLPGYPLQIELLGIDHDNSGCSSRYRTSTKAAIPSFITQCGKCLAGRDGRVAKLCGVRRRAPPAQGAQQSGGEFTSTDATT
jgi:hypothetical protein